MSKTPIMVLQEAAIKHGFVPNYQEMPSVYGTHNNRFVIRVSCMDKIAEGVATSKKQAKQNAAKEMLILLTKSCVFPHSIMALLPSMESSDSNSICDDINVTHKQLNSCVTDSAGSSLSSNSFSSSPVSSTNVEESFVNYVGKLKELCDGKHLPEPRYGIIETTGMAHNPTFTMSCTVDTVQREATASTKKHAKQKVAKLVLRDILGESNFEIATGVLKCLKDEDVLASLGVELKSLQIVDSPKLLDGVEKERLMQIYKEKTLHHVNVQYSFPIDQYHTIVSELLLQSSFNIDALRDLSTNEITSLKDAISMAFRKPLEEVYFSVNCELNVKVNVIGFRIPVKPVVLQIGKGETMREAQMDALIKLCGLICTFME